MNEARSGSEPGLQTEAKTAFIDFYRRYSPGAMGVAFRVLGQSTPARDVLQEVFVSIEIRSGDTDGGAAIPRIPWARRVNGDSLRWSGTAAVHQVTED